MVDDPQPGMIAIRFVTEYGVHVTHGFVLLGLRIPEPNSSEPRQFQCGLEAWQAIELGKSLIAHGEELLAQE